MEVLTARMWRERARIPTLMTPLLYAGSRRGVVYHRTENRGRVKLRLGHSLAQNQGTRVIAVGPEFKAR
jgi:hypothetical protein